MFLRNLLYTLIFCFLQIALNAQIGDGVKFRRIGEDYGISHTRIRSIYEDQKGFLWFGTNDGLNRFDGYECKVFRPTNEKGNSFGYISVISIAQKSKDELWVGTNFGLFTFSNNKLELHDKRIGGTIRKIIKRDDDTFWILRNFDVFIFNPKTSKLQNFEDLVGKKVFEKEVFDIFQDSKGDMWFTSVGEVIRYNISNNSFKYYNEFIGLDPSTRNDILTITEDYNGKIWIGFGQNGLFSLDTKRNRDTFRKYRDGNIMDLLVDSSNILWVARNSNKGLLSIDLLTGEEKGYFFNQNDPNSINDNSIGKLFEDSSCDLWIGTFSKGMNYYSKRGKKIYSLQRGVGDNSLQSNFINAIFEDNDNLWIGTEAGADRYDKKKEKFTHYAYEEGNINSLYRDPIRCIGADKKGDIWIGTWDGGINKYNPNTDNFTRYTITNSKGTLNGYHAISVKKDSKGRFWLGTFGGGLHEYNYKEDKFEVVSQTEDPEVPLSKYVMAIDETKGGNIVYNTYRSLQIYNPSTGSLKAFDLGDQLDIYTIRIIGLYVDSIGNIWVCTNIGLYQFKEGIGEFVHFSLGEKYENTTVVSIVEDEYQNLWVGTNKGLVFVNTISQEIARFTKEDGLNSNQFKMRASFKSANGTLYFGSSNGVNFFEPSGITKNLKKPNLEITSLSVLKSHPNFEDEYEYVIEDLSSDEEIVLEEDYSNIVISFTGLNFLDTHKNRYKYKLEGYDEIWIDSGNKRTATYTNLPQGKYTFKVQGMNNDGIPAIAHKEILIIKEGPWYLSNWFKTLAYGLLIILPILFYYLRLSIFKRQRALLTKKVRERTEDLTAANQQLQQKTVQIQHQNEELSLHRNFLEEKVSKRTEQLRKAKLKAEESDRLKSSFIANMSHEIRTPMNSIYGFSNLLGDEDTDEDERQEYIEIIKDSCDTLLVLIDDILDISIMDAQGIELNFQEIELEKFLAHLDLIFRPKTKRGVELIIEGVDKKDFIKSDPVRLRQVFTNLLNNAIKFTDKGSIRIGYRKTSSDITFFVKDTGIGIAEKDLTAIFKPFIKARNNDGKVYRGTGIGLSITQRVVNSFKGEIWVESELNKGAAFFVKLPI